jgi:hypothetical protein
VKQFAHPFVALYFGAFFLCAVTCTHLDDIVAMPLSVVSDLAAGIILIAGAIAGHRNWARGRPYQIAAWAFITSLLFDSVLGNFQDWMSHSADAAERTGLISISQGSYLAIETALLLFSCVGLAGSLVTGSLET